MSESPAREHRTVSRVTTILEAVAAHPAGLRLNELAERLSAPKSSVFGLVKGLVATGYLVEVEGRYRVGSALTHLMPTDRPSLGDAAGPLLRTLRDRFGETAMIATPTGDSMMYVCSAESPQVIRYHAALRERRPLFPPSAGKAILSRRSTRRQEAYLRSLGLPEESLSAALRELEQVAADGFAFNRGETLLDVSAAARPVLSGARTVAAIAVAGPTTRILSHLPDIAAALESAVQETSARLSVMTGN